MKLKFCLLAGIILIALFSCKKDDDQKQNGPLTGTWELRSVYGGYSATGGGNFEPGNGSIWQFSDNNYWYYSEGVTIDSGSYKQTSGINPQTNINTNALVFKNDTGWNVYYQITGDTLTLYSGVVAADGTVSKYVRVDTPEWIR